MKKRTLKEELERIHTITYGKKVLLENDLLNKLIKGGDVQMSNPVDDPVKADYVDDNVRTFLNDLKSIDHPITQQESGTMEYQKEVELLQIGLPCTFIEAGSNDELSHKYNIDSDGISNQILNFWNFSFEFHSYFHVPYYPTGLTKRTSFLIRN